MELIDREALKTKLEKMADMNNPKWSYDSMMIAKIMIEILNEAPIVEERKHSYWKKEGSWYKCGCCNSAIDPWDNTWMKYCSCCGAIMDGKAICYD